MVCWHHLLANTVGETVSSYKCVLCHWSDSFFLHVFVSHVKHQIINNSLTPILMPKNKSRKRTMAEMRVIETIKNNQEGKWICMRIWEVKRSLSLSAAFIMPSLKWLPANLVFIWHMAVQLNVIKSISIKSVVNNWIFTLVVTEDWYSKTFSENVWRRYCTALQSIIRFLLQICLSHAKSTRDPTAQ